VEDPEQMAQGLGVPHTSELEALIGAEYTDKAPKSYQIGEKNRPATPVIQRYWTSFIRTLDPNTFRQEGSVEWTAWGRDNQARVVMNTGGKTEMEDIDDGLRERCEYWYKHGVEMKL
jgi:carboxylesterase type B